MVWASTSLHLPHQLSMLPPGLLLRSVSMRCPFHLDVYCNSLETRMRRSVADCGYNPGLQAMNRRIPAALFVVIFIVAAAVSCAHRIVQPGIPGTSSRAIARREAVDLSQVQFTIADVKFMQGMIHHHAQALDMTALIASRTSIEKMK